MTAANLEQEDALNLTGVHVPNRQGVPDAALRFSETGSCYNACGGVRFAVNESVNEEFTFAFWVKPERSVTQRPESSACSPTVTVPMANSNQNWALYPDNGGPGGYGVGLSVGTNGVFVAEHTGNLLVSRMSYPAEIDDFVHVVVSYANDSSKLHVNGELVRQRAQPCTSGIQHLTWVRPDLDSTEVRIATGLYSPPFMGIIDDYGFWDRALTEVEIEALYASLSVPGCTDSEACNYDWEAIDDDGSCVYAIVGEDCFEGASICGEGTWWHPGLQQCLTAPCLTCPADLNSDALVTIADMLQLLASFGDACTYEGCTDENACNFAPVATVDDGSCVYGGINDCGCVYDCSGGVIGDADGDGVCDDSPVVSCGDSLACNYDAGACLFNDSLCVFGSEVPGAPCDDENPNTFNDVWNETGCQCDGVAYISGDGNGPCAGQNTLTFDNHTYQLVEIGTQCWFAEELQTTHYTNGDAIPRGLSNDEWSNANFGATGVYGENLDGCGDNLTPGYVACDSVASLENFGRPYNFFAVMDPRGLCPSGWAVATDSAWMVMEAFLGIPEAELETIAWRGTTQGTALKSTSLWYAGNNGTNEFGFNATPGGYRHNADGAYVDAGYNGNYWTGTPYSSTQGVYRMLYNNEGGIRRAAHQNEMGRYVRCVQSAEGASCFDPDGDGVCAADEVTGCTDEGACNYSAEFTESDPESCIFPTATNPCDCAIMWTDTLVLDGGESASNTFTGYGEISSFTMSVDYTGAFSNWPGDMLIGICSPSGMCIEVGGFNMSLGYEAVAEWPNAWNTNEHGFYEATMALPAGIGGDGEWEITIMNAYSNGGVSTYDFVLTLDGLCDEPLVAGCLDDAACNFNPAATHDDGSCAFTLFDACGCEMDCEGNLLNDADGDGMCEETTVTGCTDPEACNYDPNFSCMAAELCQYGMETPGTPCDDGDPNTFNDVWNESGCSCAGTPAVAADGSGPCEGETTVSYYDFNYQLLEVNGGCWFRENLATEQFSNGDSILVVGESNWTSYSPRMAYLFNDPANRYVFGGYYNWGAVSDPRGLCPSGWHEPNYSEYAALKAFVEEAGGTAEDLKMPLDSAATGIYWTYGNPTNTMGFSALPGGERQPYESDYFEVYERAYFWTASQSPSYSYSGRKFNLNQTTEISFNTVLNYRGAAVRCVKGDLAPGCTSPGFVEYDLGAEVDDGSCLTPN